MQLNSNNINKDTTFTILNWSVNQVIQLTNLMFNMLNYSLIHIDITMSEEDLNTVMNDLTFNDDAVDINMNNQQYEIKTATFNKCMTEICIIHCFACVFLDIIFEYNNINIDMLFKHDQSIVLLNSTVNNIDTVINIFAKQIENSFLVIINFLAEFSLISVVSTNDIFILVESIFNTWIYDNAYTFKESDTEFY